MRDLWLSHFQLDFALPIAPAERECATRLPANKDLAKGCPSASRSSLRMTINVAGYEAASAERSAEQCTLKSRAIQRYQQHCATYLGIGDSKIRQRSP